MIIVRLEGGLGNQMFEYAAARRLAEKHLSPLKIDLSWFGSQQLRKYKLQCFNVHEEFVDPQEVEAIIGNYSVTKWLTSKIGHKLGLNRSWIDLEMQREITAIINSRNYSLVRWWTARLKHKLGIHHSMKTLYQKGKYVREKYQHFDPELLDAPDYIYLDGFWQSEKYFLDIEEILRQDFTLKLPQSELFERISEVIASTCAVSLHIRRGDMANDPEANRLHGTCSLDYYDRAVQHIAKRINQPHFFIFSDDPIWVKEHLNLSFPSTLVSYGSSLHDYEELHLMSRCHHHITANSSFSWWGAWLNPKPDKIVITPKKWFGDFADDHDTKDLIPDNWLRL